jgi:hypothetical protein
MTGSSCSSNSDCSEYSARRRRDVFVVSGYRSSLLLPRPSGSHLPRKSSSTKPCQSECRYEHDGKGHEHDDPRSPVSDTTSSYAVER